ncbi:MAG: hypothetical protein MK193_14045 [Lentisphaeria bacterium]|nr:hypothetical protein [Lentisphaeria bacterium]
MRENRRLIEALDLEKNGNWDGAHNLLQGLTSSNSAWVHAYLHRKEGDDSNAAYWYNRAGKPMATESLNEEWSSIYKQLEKELVE